MTTKTLTRFEERYEIFPLGRHTCYVRPSEAQDLRLAERTVFKVAYLSLDLNQDLML